MIIITKIGIKAGYLVLESPHVCTAPVAHGGCTNKALIGSYLFYRCREHLKNSAMDDPFARIVLSDKELEYE